VSAEAPVYAQTRYDSVAYAYDELYGQHVSGPSLRLDEGLRLRAGERVADLACGTGLHTVQMARAVAPGETVGVDFSEGMLSAARERARAAGVALTLVNARAEDFIASAPGGTFDVVTMRFVLAYLDWRAVVPRTSRLLRPGGRIGVLTSTTGSIPQFYRLFRHFRSSIEPAWKLFNHMGRSVGDTLKMYRQLRTTFANGDFITVPDSSEVLARYLERGGLTTVEAWTDRVRLWFDSGTDVVTWMHASGYVTHNSLDEVGPDAVRFLESIFADGLEDFREPQGIPLDLVMAGVVARR
jgi:ubiquinone/menaquinone biosynthesis C-methylase UbiE